MLVERVVVTPDLLSAGESHGCCPNEVVLMVVIIRNRGGESGDEVTCHQIDLV